MKDCYIYIYIYIYISYVHNNMKELESNKNNEEKIRGFES